MSRGKHKHRKLRAQQKAAERAQVLLMKEKEVTENSSKAPAEAKSEAINNQLSRWKRLTDWMKKDKTFTDWCIAAFTLALAGAAIYQFLIMGRQLDTMRKDQRPWIDLTFQSNSNALQVGSPITAVAHLVNEGKTPARAVTTDIVIEMVKNGDQLKFDYPLPHSRLTAGDLFPNRPIDSPIFERTRTAADGISPEPKPLTQAEFDDFIQENSFIVVYGMVSYKDFFGISHWTKVCGFFPKPNGTKGARAKECADYSDIDSN